MDSTSIQIQNKKLFAKNWRFVQFGIHTMENSKTKKRKHQGSFWTLGKDMDKAANVVR